jgi:hypothetical protein
MISGKAKIVGYKVYSWLVLVLLIAFGFLIEGATGGFGGLLAAGLIFLYLQRRNHRLTQLQWEHRVGEVGKAREKFEQAVNEFEDLRYNNMIRDTHGHNPHLCKTCQVNYEEGYLGTKLCTELRDVFPHDPHAEPPHPNPFKWLWLTCHGYRMPPDDWPTTKPWLPRTALERNLVDAMTEEGRQYYMTHRNPFWDAGFGNPPEWYCEHWGMCSKPD